MRDFISEIKRINTDGVLFEFSRISIEMFAHQEYLRPFDIVVTNYGITQNHQVCLSAWDIQDIVHLSVTHSNDYRRKDDLPSLGKLVNLYREYENKHSVANEIQSASIDRIFRAILGMTAEQFQYENIGWIYEKFNRDYYILLAAENYMHRALLDVDGICGELLDLTSDEFIMVLLMIFGSCSRNPMPIERFNRIDASGLPDVLSRSNIAKVIDYYSCTYEDLRNSRLGKQLLYSKPFIKTQKDQVYISSNMYLVAMLLGNGLYWLARDYYRDKGQHFTNSFGLLFEDYIKDLGSKYCVSGEWDVIPQGKEKGADFYFDLGSIRIIVEAKSALLQLSAKQQVPDLNMIDTFFERHIKESYSQLINSFEAMKQVTERPIVKAILLYDDFSNTSIIEKSMATIFDVDPLCYVLTIRELEILLYLHRYDKAKCNEICLRIAEPKECSAERESIGATFEKMGLLSNPHLEGEMDFFSKIMHRIEPQIQ